MPWTKITRAQYLRSGLRYASDMTDAEWRLIARKLPGRRRLGRPRKVDLRKVVEAVLFILSTGCQWRALPSEFPPYSTVQGYFYAWRDTGRWHRIVSGFGPASAAETRAQTDSRRRPSSTARGLRRRRPAARVDSIRANGFTDASGTSSPIPTVCYWPSMFILPTSRTVHGAVPLLERVRGALSQAAAVFADRVYRGKQLV